MGFKFETSWLKNANPLPLASTFVNSQLLLLDWKFFESASVKKYTYWVAVELCFPIIRQRYYIIFMVALGVVMSSFAAALT